MIQNGFKYVLNSIFLHGWKQRPVHLPKYTLSEHRHYDIKQYYVVIFLQPILEKTLWKRANLWKRTHNSYFTSVIINGSQCIYQNQLNAGDKINKLLASLLTFFIVRVKKLTLILFCRLVLLTIFFFLDSVNLKNDTDRYILNTLACFLCFNLVLCLNTV